VLSPRRHLVCHWGIVRRPSTSISPWNSTFFAVVGAEGSIIGGISDSSAIAKFVFGRSVVKILGEYPGPKVGHNAGLSVVGKATPSDPCNTLIG